MKSSNKEDIRYQYYVDFKGFHSQGKKGKYQQWFFFKTDLKKILDSWDKVVWIQAGKAVKDTAIVKKRASVPLRDYIEKNPNKEYTNALYHGIGKDFSGQVILMMKYMNVDVYDPYFPDMAHYSNERQQTIKNLKVPFNSQHTKTKPEERGEGKKEYGHIHSHYTLNVVTKEKGREIIQHIYDLLSDGGKAIISVRRDIDLRGKTNPKLIP